MGNWVNLCRENKNSSSSSSKHQRNDSDPDFGNNFTNLATLTTNENLQSQDLGFSNEGKNKYKQMTTNSANSILKEENHFDSFENVLNLTTTPTGSNCIFGQNDHSLVLFDFWKNKRVKIWTGHEKDITKCVYCPKIDQILSCSRDKTVKLWCQTNEKPILNMEGHDLVVTALATNAENSRAISGSRDNKLNLWDLNSGTLLSTAQISRNLVVYLPAFYGLNCITDIFWSNDNKLLIQSGEDKEMRLWDPFNLKIVFTFPKKQYIQSSCHISSDNSYAISTSNGFQGNGCEITIWDLRSRSMLAELYGHQQTVTHARIVQQNNYIFSCSNDSTVKLWDLKTNKLIDSMYLANGLTSVDESVYSRRLLVSSLSNGIYVLKTD